jgi:hypothetical protein
MKRKLRLNPIDCVVLMIIIAGAIFLTFQAPITSALFWIIGNQEKLQQQPSSPAPAENDQDPAAAVQPAATPAAESAQEPAQIVETYKQPSQPAAQPAAPQSEPQGAHIPFTNSPVTAGDPQSYVGTVGQCPFYEMAGDKGCVPPADIECNADWSICTKKGENL